MLAAGISLGSRRVERPSDRGSVLTATLDGAAPAWVDGGGLVSVDGAGWSIDWWIGADDRWHLPAREPAVRQRRLGLGPVVETTVRIPSGDARHNVYGAVVDGRPATVVEVHNDSPVPVALALAIRPYTTGPSSAPAGSVAGPGSAAADGPRWLNLADAVVRLDDGLAVVLPRPPAQSGASVTHDILDDVLAGRDLTWEQPDSIDQVDPSMVNGALLYPLPHRTSLRFVIARDDRSDLPLPSAAPGADKVASGWTSIIDAGARFDYPDSGMTAAVAAAQTRLLLGASELADRVAGLMPGSGRQLAALAMAGRTREVEQVLSAVATAFPRRLAPGGDGSAAARIVEAVAVAAELTDTSPEPALLEFVMQTTKVIERSFGRRPWRRTPSPQPKPAVATAKRGLARLARQAGDHDGAARLLDDAGQPLEGRVEGELLGSPSAPDAAELDVRRAEGSATGAWGDDDPDEAAGFVIAARSLIVDDAGPDLVLLPGFAPSWRGGSAEAHKVPTRHGVVSFAVRWHGARPAMLWDVAPHPSRTERDLPVRICCPALDPAWSTIEARGETLLAGSAEPLPDSPMPGDSFT